jgi:LEA14-like dessication related protein
MAMVRRTVFLCLAFLVWAQLSSCALWRVAPEVEPQARLIGVRALDKSGRDQRYLLTVRIVNPTTEALAMASLSCRLKINGTLVAEGFTGSLRTLPPGSALRVEMEAGVNFIAGLKLAGGWAGGSRPDYVLETRLRRPWTWRPLVLVDAGELPLGD